MNFAAFPGKANQDRVETSYLSVLCFCNQTATRPAIHPCALSKTFRWGGVGGFRGPTGNAIPHSLTDLGATALQRDELGDLATVVPGIRRACEHVSGWVGELTNIRFFGEGGEGKKREGIYSI